MKGSIDSKQAKASKGVLASANAGSFTSTIMSASSMGRAPKLAGKTAMMSTMLRSNMLPQRGPSKPNCCCAAWLVNAAL